MENSIEYAHFFGKALDAKRGGIDAWRVQSTGEKAAVALVLNRADWLADMGYTMADAIDRIDSDWLVLVPRVARALHNAD